MAEKEPFTVGDLRRHLQIFPDDYELQFGPNNTLTFYRTKLRGKMLVQIEFNELFEITHSPAPQTKTKPRRKVVGKLAGL